ncbi:hypothetical protein D9M68_612930 [compost metagenome]
MARQQGRRGDQRHLAAAQVLRRHARHMAGMQLDLGIEAFARVAAVQQARPHIDPHLRVQGKEPGQSGNEAELRERRRYRHVQRHPRQGMRHQRVGFVDQAQGRADPFQVQRAGVRQPQPIGQALEQRRAQAVFQRADMLADRALGQVQFLGAAAEIEAAGRGQENPQRNQRIPRAFHAALARRARARGKPSATACIINPAFRRTAPCVRATAGYGRAWRPARPRRRAVPAPARCARVRSRPLL